MTNPRAFISYSWGDEAHEEWILQFANELMSQGIEVVLDKWDLQPGHDAFAFMEGMVTDPAVTKVILVCDRRYKEKADGRSGGAGAEAQILTPQLYAKAAQDKFVAVIREYDEDGRAAVPAFYGGRIYIDLLEEATYASEFERLVRWAWGKPLLTRPALGAKPAYLDADEESSSALNTRVAFRAAADSLRTERSNVVALTDAYFANLLSELPKIRLSQVADEDDVVKSIVAFLPTRNEAVQILVAAANSSKTADLLSPVHRFFEGFIPLFDAPEGVNSWKEWDFENYKFIAHELLLYWIAALLKHQKFQEAASFLAMDYYVADRRRGSVEPMSDYSVFRNYLSSLEQRGQKLRRISAHADMLHDRNAGASVEFRHILAADLVLYLRNATSSSYGWWPVTLLYAGHQPLELFARAQSASFLDRMLPVLGMASKDELLETIKSLTASGQNLPRWETGRLSLGRLVQLDNLGERP